MMWYERSGIRNEDLSELHAELHIGIFMIAWYWRVVADVRYKEVANERDDKDMALQYTMHVASGLLHNSSL